MRIMRWLLMVLASIVVAAPAFADGYDLPGVSADANV